MKKIIPFFLLILFSCEKMRKESNKRRTTIGFQTAVMMETPCALYDSIGMYLNTYKDKKQDCYFENKRLIPYGLTQWIYSESLVRVEEVAKDTTWIRVKILQSPAKLMVGCNCYVPANMWLNTDTKSK